MKKIKTVDAVGHTLSHDITQIIKDVKAGVLFKKGHIIQEGDIEKLLSVGKDHLYIYEMDENRMHENEAAEILYDACAGSSNAMAATAVHEGKIEVIARARGLLKVDTQRLYQINALGNLIIATRHNNTVIKKGDKIAGTRIIPLVIEKAKMSAVTTLSTGVPLLEIKAFHTFKVGVITTGNEIYHGRIQDTFTPVIAEKLADYDLQIDLHKVVPDDVEIIKQTIAEFREQGAELILCTGGMSVDPDDVTPTAIKAAGAEILTYGAPVLPGSMLLIGYFDDGTPVLGLPGCVMYASTTSFDLILPRILAQDTITMMEIAQLGHGGLCLKCQACTFPHCEFGKS
ncbi:MAG: molybdopterin-binding protein [Turicibacter sp.]|nr:molybdopterin-binding protein [Turicibacter sp.]